MPVRLLLHLCLRHLLPLLLAAVALFVLLDHLDPLPLERAARPGSLLVAARDGAPLRAFADERGVWRYPVRLEELSPLYLEALIGYEDRWFYAHPGINPFAMARAAWQWLTHGEVVSGGSTLTMQVARLLDPPRDPQPDTQPDTRPRSLAGKVRQMWRALQLEAHLTKREILEIYVNLAPFGGPLEGVQAASFAYLGKPARELSHAEAALLAVLPQAPSRLRPDRHPERAARARDKVVARLAAFGVWSPGVVAEARAEAVRPRFAARPMLAPLLARRLRQQHEEGRLITTIDAGMQWALEQRVAEFAARQPPAVSVALLVVENRDMAVRAYVGSAAFGDEERAGHVDMVRALRSPGSTLKPFLYGFALDEGLIHSESLLADVPREFGAYRPANFSGGFSGPVSAAEALRRSLNVPAVELLERFGVQRFDARLRNAGLHLAIPGDGRPSLALILGGAGSDLESLVSLYAALGRGGAAAPVRYREDEPLAPRPLLSPGAAWTVWSMLAAAPPPQRPWRGVARLPVAWKTGTSYGYRDAWALGVTPRYTVGVWVGRPDGTPVPGHYGAVTAAPLLFDVIEGVGRGERGGLERPPSVAEVTVCWPLGIPPAGVDDPLCHVRRTAWSVAGVLPPTFADEVGSGGRVERVWLDRESGLRLAPGCGARWAAGERAVEERAVARWPRRLGPWLNADLRARALPPPYAPGCGGGADGALKLTGLAEGAVLLGRGGEWPRVSLAALGAEGELYWLVNEELKGRGGARHPFAYRFPEAGRYEVTVFDAEGDHDRVTVTVEAARE